MKLIVLVALIGAASAQFGRPRPAPQAGLRASDVQILRQELNNDGLGTFNYAYETSDGTSASQKGYLRPPPQGSDEPIQVLEGTFQFYSPEGETFKLDYLADENGFQPSAAHLPTSPPIPEEIARALEIIYRNAGDQRASSVSFQAPRPRASSNYNRRF